jgi:hypothetical protein
MYLKAERIKKEKTALGERREGQGHVDSDLMPEDFPAFHLQAGKGHKDMSFNYTAFRIRCFSKNQG